MPRKARPHTPGSPHHLIARFVNHEFRLGGVFEREAFKQCMARARRRTRIRIIAYALMSSHVHIAAVGDETPLGDFLHRLDTAFGRWWNDHHGGFGPVFAERPSSDVIEDVASLARVVPYIHNNPCRAGLVSCPSLSDWTSHRAMIGIAPCPTFLDDEWTLDALGFANTPRGRMAFHELVVSRCELPRDPQLSSKVASDDEVRGFIDAASRIWDLDRDGLCRPRTKIERDARLVMLATADRVMRAKGKQLAAAMGISRSFMSRLLRKARGKAEPELVEAYLHERGWQKKKTR